MQDGPGSNHRRSVQFEDSAQSLRRFYFLGVPFDRLDASETLTLLSRRRAGVSFGYVVTPNVQHVTGSDRDPALLPLIESAWLSLCDSRPLRLLGRWSGKNIPLVTGSDLTVALFREVIEPGDRIGVICPSTGLSDELRSRRPDLHWDILVPPPGCEPGTQQFSGCVDFIAENQARFFFVCLGAPKSEAMCHAAAMRPETRGTALCVGASLEFMLGLKARAPRIFQRLGLEWLHRMLTEPRRLGGRYISSVVPLASLWIRELRGVNKR